MNTNVTAQSERLVSTIKARALAFTLDNARDLPFQRALLLVESAMMLGSLITFECQSEANREAVQSLTARKA